ncbi:MAG: tetratricopeptide repeat protein [bacterium]
MTTVAGPLGTRLALRWDFVTDPPTKFLAGLDTARTRLRRGQLGQARTAARRLLRDLDAKWPPNLANSLMPARLAELRASALAIRAIASARLVDPDAAAELAVAIAAYEDIVADGQALRPPSLASYGMALVLTGRAVDAVEPLARAAESGEDVLTELVERTARDLIEQGQPEQAVRLLRAVHERYPREAGVAAALARACADAGDPAASAEAHVAAGALFASRGDLAEAQDHFSGAQALVPGHPLAAMGYSQALAALGRADDALAAVTIVAREQPGLAGAHAVIALVLALQDKPADAWAVVDAALETFAEDPWLLDTRIRLLLDSGDTAAALAAVDRALAVDPTDRGWRGMHAELRIARREDTDEGIETLRELAASAGDDTEPVLRLASALLAVGRRREALRVVERACADHPDDLALLIDQTRLLALVGRHSDASDSAYKAIALGAEPAVVASPLAVSLLALGDVDGAERAADQALSRDPDAIDVRRIRGLLQHRAGHHGAAVADLEAVLSAEPEDDQSREALAASATELGLQAADQGNHPTAVEWLSRALALVADDGRARQALTETLRRAGDYAAALHHADLGLSHHPDDAWLLGTRGQVHLALDDLGRAEEDLRRALDLDPSLAWARSELGDLLRTTNHLREALQHLQRVTHDVPDDARAWASRGAAEFSLDRYDEAVASLDQALALDPDYAFAHAVKGAVLCDVDEVAGARTHLDRGLELDPTQAWALTQRAWLSLLFASSGTSVDLERAHSARDDWAHALDLEPGSTDALIGLAEVDFVLGEPDGAEHLESAVASLADERAPDADALASLGWCRLRLGDPAAAIEAFVQAMAKDPRHISAAFDLSLALLCAGRYEVALEEYAQAVARVRAVRHPGRRRHLLRVARRDLRALCPRPGADLKEPAAEVERILNSREGSRA